jgi:hypothetical protein
VTYDRTVIGADAHLIETERVKLFVERLPFHRSSARKPRPSGRERDAQVRWRDFCRAWEIPYVIVRAKAGESAQETVDRWIQELRGVIS